MYETPAQSSQMRIDMVLVCELLYSKMARVQRHAVMMAGGWLCSKEDGNETRQMNM